jgi:diguanylate cyclase (GGDEF)-like protein
MEPAVQSRATQRPDGKDAIQDRRLRAVYRRELQTNVRLSALVAVAVLAIVALASCAIRPEIGPTSIALSVPLIAIGLGVTRVVRHRARRHVVILGMIVGLLPVIATALAVTLVPGFEALALGCVGLIIISFAIFIPLERHLNLAWLAIANVTFFVLVPTMRSTPAVDQHAAALLITCIIATALSIGASEVQLRRRHQMAAQLLAVRGLYGRMKDHEIDLRRQDEFLFMQQETLVVQQAELLRLNEELETIARLDALTGLGNRLRLNEDLTQIAGRIERHGGTAGLLLMDLDRFKRLNDTMGHLAGDAALQGVAEVLRKTSRVGDGLYRYGGEEFLVILHDCDESVLEMAGQRYLTAIEAAGMPHPDNPPYGVVTASAGATELSQANCTDVDAALRDSDDALYEAKANGRNRLQLHVRPEPADVVQIDQKRAAS